MREAQWENEVMQGQTRQNHSIEKKNQPCVHFKPAMHAFEKRREGEGEDGIRRILKE